MALILALETSTDWCSVALIERTERTDGSVRVAVRAEQTGPKASARLLPQVAEVCAELGVALTDVDAVAFGAGPGAFTGLRTCCGVAQGLAFGLDVPVIPVSSLAACAERVRARIQNLPTPPQVVVAVDARMGEVYCETFALDDDGWRSVAPAAVVLPEAVAAPAADFWLVGNAAAVYPDRLALAASALEVDTSAMPRADAVAVLALAAWDRGDTVPAECAAPVYVRNKVAQTIAERQAAP